MSGEKRIMYRCGQGASLHRSLQQNESGVIIVQQNFPTLNRDFAIRKDIQLKRSPQVLSTGNQPFSHPLGANRNRRAGGRGRKTKGKSNQCRGAVNETVN